MSPNECCKNTTAVPYVPAGEIEDRLRRLGDLLEKAEEVSSLAQEIAIKICGPGRPLGEDSPEVKPSGILDSMDLKIALIFDAINTIQDALKRL